MNGTKLPEAIRKLSEEKEITLFIDGDRGGKLIARNVIDNARVKYITSAPDGKEVEELTGKEIFMNLRRKVPVDEFLRKQGYAEKREEKQIEPKKVKLDKGNEEKLKEISDKNQGSGKAILLNESLEEIKKVSVRGLSSALRKIGKGLFAMIIDGTVTRSVISAAEDAGCNIIVAKNFATTDTNIELLSL